MVSSDPFFQSEIRFVEKTHQYFNLEEVEYKSVSRAIKGIQVPFDSQKISEVMAKKIAAENGISESQAQKELLEEWAMKRDDSLDKGDYVHDSMERYAIKGTYDEEMKECVQFLLSILKEYYRYFPEVIIHSHKYRMAGRTDMALIRQKSKYPVVDFLDYKSNISKGIQFDSIGRKTIPIRHYNRFLLPPLDYLEDCNYNTYSLQLSIYAFMAIERLKVRIGKLSILFVDNDFKPHLIPVPFMYQEAKLICEMNVYQKSLPTVSSSIDQSKLFPDADRRLDKPFENAVTSLMGFNPDNVKEDW